MSTALPPIPFPSTATPTAIDWLMRNSPTIDRIRTERAEEARRYRSEADAARNAGEGCPADDQQVMEFES